MLSRKVEILYDMSEEKLQPMKNEMSRGVSEKVKGFHASCMGSGVVEAVDSSIICPARLDTCTETVFDYLTGKTSQEGHRQKLYSDI